ncbi:MAG: calcium/sodium antiporter [Nanoarchaeota archaeon]
MLLFTLLIFLISFVLLVKGSDLFVDEASRVARLFGVSELVIGLTIVSIGTSFPELASSLYSAFVHQTTIAIGTIIGSNIVNIGLVLAVGALLAPIVFVSGMYQKDAWILLGITLLFIILSFDGSISLVEGILFVVLFAAYIIHLLRQKQPRDDRLYTSFYQSYVHATKKTLTFKNHTDALDKGLTYRIYQRLLHDGVDVKKEFRHHLLHSIYLRLFFCAVGVIGLSVGAKYLVSSSLTFAAALGISPTLIALTFVAVGTSLPELFVTIASARKKLGSILVGNIIGSNIANLLFVGGVAALIEPLQITHFDYLLTLPALLFMTVVLLHFIRSKWMSKVFQGLLLLLFYSIFLFFVVLLHGFAL